MRPHRGHNPITRLNQLSNSHCRHPDTHPSAHYPHSYASRQPNLTQPHPCRTHAKQFADA
jgi:hypothetical protein